MPVTLKESQQYNPVVRSTIDNPILLLDLLRALDHLASTVACPRHLLRRACFPNSRLTLSVSVLGRKFVRLGFIVAIKHV